MRGGREGGRERERVKVRGGRQAEQEKQTENGSYMN